MIDSLAGIADVADASGEDGGADASSGRRGSSSSGGGGSGFGGRKASGGDEADAEGLNAGVSAARLGASVLTLGLIAWSTFHARTRSGDWESEGTLFRAALRTCPDSIKVRLEPEK